MEKHDKPKHVKRNAFKSKHPGVYQFSIEISNAIRDNIKIVDEPKFIDNVLEREQAKNILLNK